MSRNLMSGLLATVCLSTPALAEPPRVATDIAPVHSLVARVMAGVGAPGLIVAPGASPHEYNLRPSEAATVQDADLVFWIGPDLTPWLEGALTTLAEDANVIALIDTDGTLELPVRESALFEAHDHGDHADHDDHDHDDHADHDDHSDHDDHNHDHDDHADHDDHDHDDHADHDGHAAYGHDPHAWLSPDNAAVWMNVIAAELTKADPDNADLYAANLAAARDELEQLKTEIETVLAPVRGRSFVVFHDAYQYFETAFDMPAAGAISLSDASDPSPARITEIQARVVDQQVACVLSEPQFAPGIVDAVMNGTPARHGVLDPLGANLEPGPQMYPQLLRQMAQTLAECL